uniref:AfsR/SARP family transcriptional regulator n=1 Tax=Paractinoplanes polyasparticus TaxID=2856853 RepID=UPI001C854BF3|nr:BTAD domain-containing putative transcriptional regulator [Actinoplanes polyasparticus]
MGRAATGVVAQGAAGLCRPAAPGARRRPDRDRVVRYRLAAGADEVDARRFERLLDRARELLVLDAADHALFVAGEALALWRGPALPELEAWEPGRIEAGRLAELRLEAEELRVEAALATATGRR